MMHIHEYRYNRYNRYANDNTDSRIILTMAIASLAQTTPPTATATRSATCQAFAGPSKN